MDPKEFDNAQAKEQFYKNIAQAQMEIEVIAMTGIILPGSMKLVQAMAASLLGELQDRGLLRTPAELMIEKIRQFKNQPEVLKKFMKMFGGSLDKLPPEVVAELPKEAFE